MAHFTARGYDGKAMVVSIDRKTTVRMYAKVKEEMKRHLAKMNMAPSRGRMSTNEKCYENRRIGMRISTWLWW